MTLAFRPPAMCLLSLNRYPAPSPPLLLTPPPSLQITVLYPHAAALVSHLRRMGEGGAGRVRPSPLSRDVALAAAATYATMWGGGGGAREGGGGGDARRGEGSGGPLDDNRDAVAPGGPDEGLPATYQVIYLTGWAPAPGQQRPKARGSATVSFQELTKDLDEPPPPPAAVTAAAGP